MYCVSYNISTTNIGFCLWHGIQCMVIACFQSGMLGYLSYSCSGESLNLYFSSILSRRPIHFCNPSVGAKSVPCQKLSKLVEIWWSYDKIKFAQFFLRHGVPHHSASSKPGQDILTWIRLFNNVKTTCFDDDEDKDGEIAHFKVCRKTRSIVSSSAQKTMN